MRTQFYHLICFLMMAATLVAEAQQTYTWNGGGGDWNVAGNWTPSGVPGVGDTAIVAGDVALGNNITIGGLTFTNGTISGDYDIEITGKMTWTKGALAGNGELQINSGAMVTISGSSAKDLDERNLENSGNIVWDGSGTIRMENGSQFNNLAGGTVDAQADAFMDFIGLPGGTFSNAGTFQKTAGSGNTTIDVFCTNTGNIAASSGTIKFTRGGNYGGTFTPSAGGIVRFNGGYQLLDNVSASGTGIVQLASDSLEIGSSGFTVNAGTTFLISGGILTGSGNVTVPGILNWTGGTIGGSGSFSVTGSYNFTGSNDKTLNTQTLNVNGPGSWTGDGDLKLTENASFQINGDTLEIQTDADVRYVAPSGGTMSNSGTILKTVDNGTCAINVALTNTGTIHSSTGKILINNISNATNAAFFSGSSGTIEFGDFAHSFQTVVFDSSGSIMINKSQITLSGGGLTINAASTVTMDGSGAEIAGSGNLTIHGRLNWLRGTISGSGSVVNNGTVEIGSARSRTLSERVFTNNNDIIWTGTGSLRFTEGVSFQNAAAGTFDFQIDALLDSLAPGGGTFTNMGTIEKTAGAAIATIDVPVNNNGTIDVSSGTLRLTRGGTGTGGSYTIGSGATVEFDGGTHQLTNIGINSSGTMLLTTNTLQVNGNDVTINTPGILAIAGGFLTGNAKINVGGTLDWTGGTISLDDTLRLTDSTSISSASTKNLVGGVVENSGVVLWSGSGDVDVSDQAVIINNAAAVFKTDAAADLAYQAPMGGRLINDGTFRKFDALIDSEVSIDFINNGTLEIQEGQLDFSDTLSNTTTGLIQGNGTLRVSNADFINHGTIAPGLSPGKLLGRGTFPFQSDAILSIEIGGPTAGVGYDRLALSQDAELDGILNVKLIDGFVPAAGDTFRVMTFSSRSGTFNTFNSPVVFNTTVFNITYNSDEILLTAQAVPNAVAASAKVWLEGAVSSDSMHTTLNQAQLLPLAQPFNTAPWLYSGGEALDSIPDGVVDWVLLELRSALDSSLPVSRQAAFLLKDGSIVDTSGSGPVNILAEDDMYFLVVHHHNHLSVMSALALTLGESATLYDFTTAQTQAFGTNPMKEVSTGKFALYAGESNGDGGVDAQDKNSFWRLQNGTVWQYSKFSDFNLDGGVDVLDLNHFWRSNNGASTQVPSDAEPFLPPGKAERARAEN